MQERLGEVSVSTKQDRLPQLFLINKFPGPLNSLRGEKHPHPQPGREEDYGQRPHGPGPHMGVNGSGRTQNQEVAGTGFTAADSHPS